MSKLTDILQPWQSRYFQAFQTESRMISLCSRQIGKSFIAAYCCVYDCVLNGAVWTLVSTGQRAADELFRKCLLQTRWFEGMLRGTRLHFSFQYNASEIRFSNGGSIVSCPNNPDGLRGKSSSLLFDEMAFIQNADECFQACIPFLTSPYGATKKLQIISTPGACSGKFYELWKDSPYFHTKVTLPEAISEGLDVNLDEIRKTVLDDDIFRQEYLCEFMDANAALFSYELLRSRTYFPADIALLESKSPTAYAGIDIGRTHDKTSIAILLEHNGVYYVHHVESLRNKEFSEQLEYLSNVLTQWRPKRVCVDASGIGANLAETLHKKFPQVSEVKFTSKSKNEMFALTKQMLGSGTLLLPNEKSLLEDLHKIQKVISPSGQITYSAKSDKTGHSDEATSVVLAVYASSRSKTVFDPIF